MREIQQEKHVLCVRRSLMYKLTTWGGGGLLSVDSSQSCLQALTSQTFLPDGCSSLLCPSSSSSVMFHTCSFQLGFKLDVKHS